ncbi:MAG: hypothetical protein KatS3mg131_0717 [Candidatus Tectimicrobiota bacterium]|nr:MAG: hypothetical protein KatS3mg131_0717 [Candidatus Tectomicrobia bacterium]
MATNDDTAKLVCPCCKATLVVDRATLAVLYVNEQRDKGSGSFDQALQALKEKEKQLGSRFQQAMAEEKQRRALLDKKFKELQKQAAAKPDERPPRPFDFD